MHVEGHSRTVADILNTGLDHCHTARLTVNCLTHSEFAFILFSVLAKFDFDFDLSLFLQINDCL